MVGITTTITFSEEIYAVLAKLSKKTGRTNREVIVHAIALYKYFSAIEEQGGRILVERPKTYSICGNTLYQTSEIKEVIVP